MANKIHVDEDEKDSLFCGVCFEFYDDAARTPKFLQCFHTCCLTCLKGQAKNKRIDCPYCRKTSHLHEQQPDQLTSNFYILPKVQKVAAFRRQLETIRSEIKDNWAQTIALRRTAEAKLKNVHDALRLLECIMLQRYEENNEKIAMVQSLLEAPTANIEDLLLTSEKWEEDLKLSQKELSDAKQLSNVLLNMEKFTCNLMLEDQSGKRSDVVSLRNHRLSLDKTGVSSVPKVDAAQRLLTYIIYELNEYDLIGNNGQNGAFEGARAENGSALKNIDQDTFSDNKDSTYSYAYLQLRVNGVIKPNVVIRLDNEQAPVMCRAFMEYCCGGINSISYKGTKIFKTGHSISGGKFEDMNEVHGKSWREKERRYFADLSCLREAKGAVRMRFRGRGEQSVYVGSEFSIICSDEQLNVDQQITTVFGHVSSGMEVCEEISGILGSANNDVVILDCGEWQAKQKKKTIKKKT